MPNTTIKSIGLASFGMSVSINRAQKSFNELLKTCLERRDLTIPKWSIPGKIYLSGAVRLNELALLGVKPPFTAKLTGVPEAEGFVI